MNAWDALVELLQRHPPRKCEACGTLVSPRLDHPEYRNCVIYECEILSEDRKPHWLRIEPIRWTE